MKRKRIKLPFKVILIACLILAIFYFSIRSLLKLFLTSEYFKVRDIITNNEDVDLSYLKGINIFTVDLDRLSSNLNSRYPDYRTIVLARCLPNCICVDFKKREVIAYVKLYRYFAVDERGVLFNPEGEDLKPDIPVILGLQTKIFGPKSGARFDIKELRLALDLIREVKNINKLSEYNIKKINASDARELSFYILDNTEVKIGEEIKEKLMVFSSLLAHISSELKNIRYIDLRFREPVIRYEQ